MTSTAEIPAEPALATPRDFRVRAGGRVLLFLGGRCVAGPVDLGVMGLSFEQAANVLGAAGIAIEAASDAAGGSIPLPKTAGTERSHVAVPHLSAKVRDRGAESATETKSKRGTRKLLSLSAVCRRLRLGKGRFVREVALGRVAPDFTTDSGLVLFYPRRLRAIARKLNSKIKFP